MIWFILLIALAAVLAAMLFYMERRYEKRGMNDAQRELDRVQHRIDTMTVELETPRESGGEDRYLDRGGRASNKDDSGAAPEGSTN